MAGIGQYLKDTQAELKHVAWPTRTQTIVYTVLVAAISLGVAAYLGVFDYLFTTGLTYTVNNMSAQNSGVTVTQQPATGTTTPLVQGTPVQIVAPSTSAAGSQNTPSTNTK